MRFEPSRTSTATVSGRNALTTGPKHDDNDPDEYTTNRKDIGEVEDRKPRHCEIVHDLTRQRCVSGRSENPIHNVPQTTGQNHRKEKHINKLLPAPYLDRNPPGQTDQHPDENHRHDRTQARTQSERHSRIEHQPQIKGRNDLDDPPIREVYQSPLLHELVEEYAHRHHRDDDERADETALGEIRSNVSHPTTIQKILNYSAYPAPMTTKWNAPALTARLRLIRTLTTVPNSSLAASTKLCLVDIANDVDRGALSPEQAERLLADLSNRLEARENHE